MGFSYHVFQIFCKSIFDCSAIEHVQSIYDPVRGYHTTILTPEECMLILEDKRAQWRLFPSKRIVVDAGFVAYRLMTGNFRNIIRNSKCITATRDIKRECRSIAFGDGRATHIGYQYTVHYYGSDVLDVSNIIDHMRVHLPVAAKHCTKGPLAFRIILSNTTPEAKVLEKMSKLKGCIEAQLDGTLFIYERNRRPAKSKL